MFSTGKCRSLRRNIGIEWLESLPLLPIRAAAAAVDRTACHTGRERFPLWKSGKKGSGRE